MYYIYCTEWLCIKRFKGTMQEAVVEINRLSEFHGASFELLNQYKITIGTTYLPEPSYIFKAH